MANTSIFTTIRNSFAPKADTVNLAGGIAYEMEEREALAQFVVTGCFNGTFYQTAEDQLDKVISLAAQVDDVFLAQTALYSRKRAYMKDAPALLCAILAGRNTELFNRVFSEVIDNGKMLRNFVQIMRSGVTGRTSLGSAPKKRVQEWLNGADDDALLFASVGNAPSLADVIKMVHPSAKDARREAYYGHIIGNKVVKSLLPEKVQAFEAWKRDRRQALPDVPFQLLTSQALNMKDWMKIAENASWQMARMNLNTFARHGVFKKRGMVQMIAGKLSNTKLIRRARVFPYQLLAAYLNVGDAVPVEIRNALQKAMEISLENVPEINGKIAVCVDISGSMHSPATGYRKGSSSALRCIDVAALVGAAILRKNPDALILPFENKVVKTGLNAYDSVMTNARKLASLPFGGTNCSAPLKWINQKRLSVDMVVFVSDNESWLDSPYYGRFGTGSATATMDEWTKLKRRCVNAKMACIDITPHDTKQMKSRKDVLNIGGFSDQVFKLLAQFAKGDLTEGHCVSEIEKEEI
ncbi:MAG: vWA domain-containing protein [Akkermansiaceae bacterium]